MYTSGIGRPEYVLPSASFDSAACVGMRGTNLNETVDHRQTHISMAHQGLAVGSGMGRPAYGLPSASFDSCYSFSAPSLCGLVMSLARSPRLGRNKALGVGGCH